MANILSEIVEAFETTLQTVISNNASLPILQRENKPKRVGGGTEWIRLTILPARAQLETIGPNGITASKGIAQIDIFQPDDVGASIARTNADIIVNNFTPGKQLTSTNGVIVVIVNSYPIPALSITNTYQQPVHIEYISYNHRVII
jgi:hypothetical protein